MSLLWYLILIMSIFFCLLFFQDKLKPIEPVDYETYILQKRSAINNDPLRSMVMFPYDDVSVGTQRLSSCAQLVCYLTRSKRNTGINA